MWKLIPLPYEDELETRTILKLLPAAHAALAELKGLVYSIPNHEILLNTLALQEAKDSSAVENIITTHDELFKSDLEFESMSPAIKEVQNYVAAMKRGFELVQSQGMLTNQTIIQIQETLEGKNAGFRKLPGTALKNAQTGETVYLPPQDANEILELMANLEQFINRPQLSDYDELVRMAIIHLQFESIHPFYDGNGRTGRILNTLYLILCGLQKLPILYLSSHIIRNKTDYYKLLQGVRENGDWQSWLTYMIKGVENTARDTISLIENMEKLMAEMKVQLRDHYKFYSQELLNNLFKHPYTKIEFVVRDLGVSRITAANYLNKLAEDGVLRKEKLGTGNYYVNEKLYNLLPVNS
ncbi:Fic family protein [Algoriphagus halophytocola]|uniref:Fic family protein n=1 Tax=Algoriphagus halophytocola TaxID=2991499 RepID=A0ABY6MFC8_9BACT|nr:MULTISPECIES: Fic/DOC family N-terminal domain-containing protein [unclassified Algoriphagus]UZD21659.1 Fic family protein [Algoriphagus sp. TR-M5]WBL42871.1 Fic family protein [Algoriphagus sp. TR-M9]